jgi:hypothetical protein
MRKYLVTLASVALSLGLVFAVSGVASAKNGGNKHHKGGDSGEGVSVGYGYGNGKHHGPTVATGSTSCNFHGKLTISSSGTVKISGNITPKHGRVCTSTGGTKLKTGHFSTSLWSATSTTALACPPVGPLPNVSGGTISWSPRPKVAASVGVALTGGTVSVVTDGSKQYLQIAYTGGSVASGSFATASGVTLTGQSNEHVSTHCGEHSHSITFHGTLTL